MTMVWQRTEDRKITRLESLGQGVTRVHAPGHGFADISARYEDGTWIVFVVNTNIQDAAVLQQATDEYRQQEGM